MDFQLTFNRRIIFQDPGLLNERTICILLCFWDIKCSRKLAHKFHFAYCEVYFKREKIDSAPLHSQTEELIHQFRLCQGSHWSLLRVVNPVKHGSCSGKKSLNVNIFLLSGMGQSDQMMPALISVL